jgi:hypothetical protein
MRKWKQKVSGVVGALAALASIGAGSAQAEGRGVMQMRGTQEVVDPVSGVYAMNGGLLGIMVVTGFEVRNISTAGVLTASGTERFIGCLDLDGSATCEPGEPTGSIDFTFSYSGKFMPDFSLIRSRCHHPMVSGTGDFADVEGVLTFAEVGGAPATYRGHLRW